MRKTSVVWLIGLLVFLAVPVLGGSILVLRGPNAGPYKEALSGLRQVYPGGTEIEHGKTREFLSRIHSDPPSLIVAIGRASADMAHQRASTIPMLFVMVPDPKEEGLTGPKVGGISMSVPGNVQLAHFKELLPNPKKAIAVVFNPASSAAMVAEATNAAPGLNLLLEQVAVESPEQVRLRLEFVKPIIGAIWVIPDESFILKDRNNKWFKYLLGEAADLRLPFFVTMNAGSTFVQEGALAAVVSDYLGMGRQCGELVKKIESGDLKIENLGIVPPEAVSWEINSSTAEKIGLTLPPALLNSAKIDR